MSEAVEIYFTFNGGLSLRSFFRVAYCYKKYDLFVVYYFLVIPLVGLGVGRGGDYYMEDLFIYPRL
jgi:hypothetical protein